MRQLTASMISVRQGAALLVDAVSLELGRGELFGLIGPNGAGKTSLLRAMAQLLPHQGQTLFDDTPLEQMTAATRALHLAYLAQGDHAAWPLTVSDFVALGRLPHRRDLAVNRMAVEGALAHLNLQSLAERRINTLSGGERARVRLARALAVEAPLLLADEPVAALDPYHQLSVMERLRELCAQGASIIIVLHDLTLASRFCDRVLLMHHGQSVACGPPRQVLTPAHLQQVYQVQTIHGEHDAEPYILPWRCQPQAVCHPTPSLEPSVHAYSS